jgi:hypothetical protein
MHKNKRASTVFLLVLACIALTSRSQGQAKNPAPKNPQASTCIGPPNHDANLDAVVSEVFKNKARRLLEQKIVTQEFFDSVRDARYEICDDRTWDVVAFPRTPPFVAFDSYMLSFLAMQSESLILGQYLANDYPRIGPLDLHTTLMRYVLEQNLNKNALKISFQDLVNKVMGTPTDISKYQSNGKFSGQVQTMFLTSLYFLIFHEFCHIHSHDPEQRMKIAAMTDKQADSAAKQAMLVRLEMDADSCAIDIMNRDEAQFKFSPISFFSTFMVSSTQAIFQKVLPAQTITHPAPKERLTNAYDTDLKFIERSPDMARYKVTLDGVYDHFGSLVPK